MAEFLLAHYLSLKALHIIAVIAWMAGLLYLPRLFVYHAGVAPDSESAALFKIMERRLLRIIMLPAMIIVWTTALLMLYANPALLSAGWMHAKLLLVIGLTGLHHVFGRWRRNFDNDANQHTAKFYRIWNEVPTVLLVIIVFLAVLKAF